MIDMYPEYHLALCEMALNIVPDPPHGLYSSLEPFRSTEKPLLLRFPPRICLPHSLSLDQIPLLFPFLSLSISLISLSAWSINSDKISAQMRRAYSTSPKAVFRFSTLEWFLCGGGLQAAFHWMHFAFSIVIVSNAAVSQILGKLGWCYEFSDYQNITSVWKETFLWNCSCLINGIGWWPTD